MSTVTFKENGRDKKLFKDIKKYRKEKGFKYPVDAVRELCEIALSVK